MGFCLRWSIWTEFLSSGGACSVFRPRSAPSQQQSSHSWHSKRLNQSQEGYEATFRFCHFSLTCPGFSHANRFFPLVWPDLLYNASSINSPMWNFTLLHFYLFTFSQICILVDRKHATGFFRSYVLAFQLSTVQFGIDNKKEHLLMPQSGKLTSWKAGA